MKRFSILLVMALATLSLLAAGTPAHAGERPFKASGAGFVRSSGLNGWGEATHIGRSALRVDAYTDVLTSGYFVPFGGSLESLAHRPGQGGDFLNFVFDEEFYYFDPATGVVNATVTFTGGTGRFQHATGSADIVFDFDTVNYSPHFDYLIDGSIDY